MDQIKKADRMFTDLETKQQKTPGQPVRAKSEIIKAIEFIESEIKNFNESKVKIIEKLIFLENNQNKLIEETGKTFKELIVELTGFSKSYFYQLTGNYKFLESQGRLDLFDKIETGILSKIKQFDSRKIKKLLAEAEAGTLTRNDLKSDMSDSIPGRQQNTELKIFKLISNYLDTLNRIDQKTFKQDLITYLHNE